MLKGYLMPDSQLAAFQGNWKTDILPCHFPLFKGRDGSLFFDPDTPVSEIEWFPISYESRFHLPKKEPMYYEYEDEEGLQGLIYHAMRYGLEMVPLDFDKEIETIAACLNLFDSYQHNTPIIPMLLGQSVFADGLLRTGELPVKADTENYTPFTWQNLEAWFKAHIGNDLIWEAKDSPLEWILCPR